MRQESELATATFSEFSRVFSVSNIFIEIQECFPLVN